MTAYIFAIKSSIIILIFGFVYIVYPQFAFAQSGVNFTSGTQTAKLRGTHEITLTGNGSVFNPFDTTVQIRFTSPSQSAVTVSAFYDGGNTWKARVYITQTGTWSWQVTSTSDSSITPTSGSFSATTSSLRGILKPHSGNPRQWMTDNGQTFLNISDTAYLLFSKNHSGWQNYARDDVNQGISSVRSMSLGNWDWSLYWSDGNQTSGTRQRPNLSSFQNTDARLIWLLNNYPQLYIQMVLFVDGSTNADSPFWASLSSSVRQKIMKYMIARWAAFPQIFWAVTNDTFVGTGNPPQESEAPKAWFWARDVGNYFNANDPWHHLMAFGHRRDIKYPFTSESWSTYIPGYASYDLAADSSSWYTSVPQHIYYQED